MASSQTDVLLIEIPPSAYHGIRREIDVCSILAALAWSRRGEGLILAGRTKSPRSAFHTKGGGAPNSFGKSLRLSRNRPEIYALLNPL